LIEQQNPSQEQGKKAMQPHIDRKKTKAFWYRPYSNSTQRRLRDLRTCVRRSRCTFNSSETQN